MEEKQAMKEKQELDVCQNDEKQILLNEMKNLCLISKMILCLISSQLFITLEMSFFQVPLQVVNYTDFLTIDFHSPNPNVILFALPNDIQHKLPLVPLVSTNLDQIHRHLPNYPSNHEAHSLSFQRQEIQTYSRFFFFSPKQDSFYFVILLDDSSFYCSSF